MIQRLLLWLPLLLLSGALPARGAVRVTPEGAVPFVVLEAETDGGQAWYDVQEWLSRFGGVAAWDVDRGRLTYQHGARTSTLDAGPALRAVDGRPLVSEAYLVEHSTEFVGVRTAVEKVHGTGKLRVVLDPGHGGAEAGSLTTGGPTEKEAMLRVAQEAAAKLRKRGFEVKLTREDDRAVTAEERAAAANRWEVDLFLSLHASGGARPQARGFEVFVAAPSASDPRLWAGGQVGREAESRRWAEAVRAAVGQVVPSFDRGVAVLPTPLLEAVAAPACLLEAGNLSWPEDAEALVKPKARAALAEALASAAEGFFRDTPAR